jgi:hypothetical protein
MPSLKPKFLQALYVVGAIAALALQAACTSTGSSSAVAPLPGHTQPPSPTPTPKPTLTGRPTPTPTPTPTSTGTATPPPTPTPTGSGCPVQNPCTQPLNPSGGELILPNVGTYTGTVGYATNDGSNGTTITFTTCTTNCFGAPNPPGATPVMWTRAAVCCDSRGFIHFNNGDQVATLTSPTLLPSQTYWLCAYIGTFPIPGGPLPAGSPVNNTLTYPSPLTGQALAATGGDLPVAKTPSAPVNIDTVLTQGQPTTCTPSRMRRR